MTHTQGKKEQTKERTNNMSIWKRMFGKDTPTTLDFRTPKQRAESEQMIADTRAGKSLGSEFDSLVEELLRTDEFESDNDKKKSTRAYQIGLILHQMGGGKVKLMREAHLRVEARHKRGGVAARYLSMCWDRIGMPGMPGETQWSD